MEENSFDIVIAGGGVAGVLAASKINEQNSNLSILLIEKEAALGGRVRSPVNEKGNFSYGFNCLSSTLYEYLNNCVKKDPEADDLSSLTTKSLESVGIVSGKKVSHFSLSESFHREGASAVAGSSAVRDWTVFDDFVDSYDSSPKKEQNFSALWKGKRKGPSSIVMEQLSHMWGIPDIWRASSQTVASIIRKSNDKFQFGRWEEALNKILERPSLQEALTIKLETEIVGASNNDDIWSIDTSSGNYTCKSLIVAHSPWDAIRWLPRDLFPPTLINSLTRTKPVSLIALSQRIKNPEDMDLPDIVVVSAESTQAIVNENEVCFQIPLDYELSLNAPEVVKAVKRLKRARKKFLNCFSDIEPDEDRLVLLPSGWTHPVSSNDLKCASKLDDQKFHSKSLLFCGDSYGSDCDGDNNLIASINAACENLNLV